MENICLVDFSGDERHGYVLGSRLPKTDPAYSAYLDIGYNHTTTPWRDETLHFHRSSEEYFVVLRGQLNFLVQGRSFNAGPGQLIGIRGGVEHQILGGIALIENFLIRVPGGGQDKILLQVENPIQPASSASHSEPILLDLHQRFADYPLGGCLPAGNANYSPLLDFSCVWGVDPEKEWENEQVHFHQHREEYYIVLSGRLDFAIEALQVSVSAGQILGVKPETRHQVIGGKGPVDLLFIRVPGGRGDKVVIA